MGFLAALGGAGGAGAAAGGAGAAGAGGAGAAGAGGAGAAGGAGGAGGMMSGLMGGMAGQGGGMGNNPLVSTMLNLSDMYGARIPAYNNDIDYRANTMRLTPYTQIQQQSLYPIDFNNRPSLYKALREGMAVGGQNKKNEEEAAKANAGPQQMQGAPVQASSGASPWSLMPRDQKNYFGLGGGY